MYCDSFTNNNTTSVFITDEHESLTSVVTLTWFVKSEHKLFNTVCAGGRLCPSARRSGGCSWPWPSWSSESRSSRTWLVGWKPLWRDSSWRQIADSLSSRRNTRETSSYCCNSVEVSLLFTHKRTRAAAWFTAASEVRLHDYDIIVILHLFDYCTHPNLNICGSDCLELACCGYRL